MKAIRFSHLLVGERFELNGLVYQKTNHSRGWILNNGRKEFVNVKREKLVNTDSKRFV